MKFKNNFTLIFRDGTIVVKVEDVNRNLNSFCAKIDIIIDI